VLIKLYLIGTPCKIKKQLRGQVIVITGANAGIGKETARTLASMRATIIFACRSRERTQPIIAEIRRETNNVDLYFIELDLSDLDSVVRFAQTFKQKHKRLDILINNAGISPSKFERTKQGFEGNIGVNHLGHYLLTKLLLDVVSKTPQSRIINVASNSHTRAPHALTREILEKINDESQYSIAS
jgi:NAD(P)-dependent dehydrogenase (short-subunit alcohol dehydrogenase family)